MTSILVARRGQTVGMMADRMVSYADGSQYHVMPAGAKVWKQSPLLIGFAGSGHVLSLVRLALYDWIIDRISAGLEWPHKNNGTWHGEPDSEAWIVKTFAPSLRQLLEAHHRVATNRDDGSKSFGGELLVATRFPDDQQPRIFNVWGGFGMAEIAEDYFAIGAGADVAFGALHTLEHLAGRHCLASWVGDEDWAKVRRFDILETLGIAMESAAHYVPCVRGPYDYLEETWPA